MKSLISIGMLLIDPATSQETQQEEQFQKPLSRQQKSHRSAH